MSSYAAAAAKSLQSCPALCNPIDCSPPGSSVHGIFQVRVLPWGAIAFLYLSRKVSPHLSPFLLLKWRPCPSAYQRPTFPLCSGFLLPSSIQGLPPFGFLLVYMLHKSLVYWVLPITTGTHSSISCLHDFTFYAPPPTALCLCPCLSKTSLN